MEQRNIESVNDGNQITEDTDVSTEIFNTLLDSLKHMEVDNGILESKA